jgi:Tfp pilus assembly protein PilZ
MAQARNMSKSGMFIVTEEARQVGEELTVAFEDEGGPIAVKLEVMWCGEAETTETRRGEQKTGLGLRIVGFDKGKEAYDKLVKRQLKALGLEDEEPKETRG